MQQARMQQAQQKTKEKNMFKKTPFCKMCYDLKKPEYVYTSHWVKDKPGEYGKVICPSLLNMQCNYCHEKGHTVKMCPILKNKDIQKKTPFCKMCYDLKKPKKIYTSHWVKDNPGPNGKVICPSLLNMQCNYCHEKGHLISNCSLLLSQRSLVITQDTINATDSNNGETTDHNVVNRSITAVENPVLKTTPKFLKNKKRKWIDMIDNDIESEDEDNYWSSE